MLSLWEDVSRDRQRGQRAASCVSVSCWQTSPHTGQATNGWADGLLSMVDRAAVAVCGHQ
ncbi:hypothetical protein PBNK5_07050 [Pectobacterium brasiliense]